MRSLWKIFCIGCFFLLFAGLAIGQSFLGSITGDVTDSSGAIVPEAKVELTEVTTNVKRAVTTNEEGRYLFPSLAPGTYMVTIKKAGFKEAKSSSMILTAQQNSRFDAKLEVGEEAQTVEVIAVSPSINTENASISNVTERAELLNLPIDRRSTVEFLYVSASNYSGNGSSNMIGGLRGTYTNFTVDGVSSNASLFGGQSSPMTEESFESIGDMKVLTSNNSAEFPSVATVLISTRSGQNTPHGSLFYTNHNHALDARSFFSGPNPKGNERHQLGGSVGGPVYIPKIYDGRDKTFFYFTWEGWIFPQSGNTWVRSVNVPTLAFKQGDFSKLGKVIKDPRTGLPFPGNIIPSDRISSVSQELQKLGMPDPNYGSPDSFTGNWRGQEGQPENVNRWVIRGDHNIGAKDKLSARASIYNDTFIKNYDSNLPAFTRHQIRHARQAFLQETHIFGTSLVNDLQIGYSRDYSLIGGGHNGTEVVQQVGLQGLTTNGENLKGFPVCNFTNFAGFSEYPTYWYKSEGFELADNVNWQKGRHSIKTGILARFSIPATSPWENDFGSFNFSSNFATGFDYADFLLGIPQTDSRVSRVPVRYNRYTNTGLYLQDAWNVNSKLTLTLGLRWEYAQPPVEKNDMRFAFDRKTGNLVVPNENALKLVSPMYPTTIPILTAQQAGYPGGRSLLNGNSTNFGPRVSFAYRMTDRTVIRGGYALFYAPMVGPVLEDFTASGPFGTREDFTNSITNGVPLLQFPNPFTTDPNKPVAGTQSIAAINPDLKTPYTSQWNMTVERELPHSIVMRASYRGFLSAQIPFQRDLNIPMASTDPNNRKWYLYPNFSRVNFTENGGIQKMSALDLEFERRYTNGLTFQAGWTMAKNQSDVGDDGERAGIENPYNRGRDMADIAYVPRHRGTGNLLWDLPFGKGKRYASDLSGVWNAILGDWQTSFMMVMQTGQFLTPTFSGQDVTNTRNTAVRPDLIGDWRVSDPSINQWFNPKAFAVPAAGQYGNCPRGVIIGPGLWNASFGVHKSFRIKENARLQIFGRATNVFNHPSFGNPNLNITSSSAGVITSVQGGRYDTLGATKRTIRVGFRLDF